MILTPADVEPRLNLLAYFTLETNTRKWIRRRIPDFQFMMIVRGDFEYLTYGQKYILQAGDIMCILPGQEHTLICVTDPEKRAILCGLRFEPCPGRSYAKGEFDFEVRPTPLVRAASDFEVRDLFYKCVKLFRRRDSIYTDELLSVVIKEIWIRLSEYWKNGGEALLSARTRKMLKYIDDHLFENISRKDVANEFKVSPEYLNAIFKKELNTSPVQYINRQRINRAYYLLMTNNYSVKECAEKTGFDNEYYFSRLFKKVTGHSPSRINK